MKIIGYMEGTDPQVLTQLLLEGYETYPLSNVFDNHGKNITLVTTEDHISLVIGYLHKFIPVAPQFSMTDILSSVKVYKIPIIFVVPEEIQDKAAKLVAGMGIDFKLADPSELLNVILETVKD
jgi:hypothetical protein